MDLDQQLLHQLNNKFVNQPVMIEGLIMAKINDHNPQDFFSGGKTECYILTPRLLIYGLASRPDRRAGNGYWKGSGDATSKIFGMNGLVGLKQKLCFYQGELNQGFKTKWNMIEYRLQQHFCSAACNHKKGKLDDWVLCKVYQDRDPETTVTDGDWMDID